MGVWPSRVNINISVAPTTVCKPAQGKSGWELPEGRTRGDGWDGRFRPGSSPLYSGLQKETSAKGDAAPSARRLGKAIPGWGLPMLTPRSPDPPACHRSPTFPPAQGSPSLSPTFKPWHAIPKRLAAAILQELSRDLLGGPEPDSFTFLREAPRGGSRRRGGKCRESWLPWLPVAIAAAAVQDAAAGAVSATPSGGRGWR